MRTIINIDVPELAPAIDFYSAALGLKLNRILDDDVAELSGASSVIYLLVKPGRSSSSPVDSNSVPSLRQYTRHWTPVHIDFVVGNVVEASDRARRAGARQEGECISWRGSRCITFSDPFGHGFCFIEFGDNTYTS